MRRFLIIIVAIVVAIGGVNMYSEYRSVSEYTNPDSGGDGWFFSVKVVRIVKDGVRPPDDIGKPDDLSGYQQISVRFLGVPINCWVSRGIQPEDDCAIYRLNWGDGFHYWESRQVVRGYWQWDGEHWARMSIAPWLSEKWETLRRHQELEDLRELDRKFDEENARVTERNRQSRKL
jgi:hypothetical protein